MDDLRDAVRAFSEKREGGKTTLGYLKTPKGRRSIRVTRAAAEALRSHLERQLEEI